jgi:hypothetical protein
MRWILSSLFVDSFWPIFFHPQLHPHKIDENGELSTAYAQVYQQQVEKPSK